MAKIQMVGDEQKLKNNSPLNEDFTPTSGGTFQAVGDTVTLDRTTTPGGTNWGTGVRGGKVQMDDAGTVDLDRTPHRGWSSYDTPISQNSQVTDTATANYPRGGK